MSVLLRWATPADTADLKQLWGLCFADSSAYIDLFFTRRFPTCRAVIAEQNSNCVGMAYLLPTRMRDGNMLRPALYGYGIGVHPSYRRQGICEELL